MYLWDRLNSKTTLVDQLLKAAASNGNGIGGGGGSIGGSNSSGDNNEERLLDCGDLEKERGITITSKVTRIDNYMYNDGGSGGGSGGGSDSKAAATSYTINVVDTPGHADFCGEVDRILSLVDGVCLVVDAGEGPMAQTKYVLSRALSLNLKPIVVLNKVDRPVGWSNVENGSTESDILDLFDNLGAADDQMEYSTLYASARDGWVTDDIDIAHRIVENGIDQIRSEVVSTGPSSSSPPLDMTTLLNKLIEEIPEPSVYLYNHDGGSKTESNSNNNASMDGESFSNDKFSLAAVTVGYDPYLGRTCTGRIYSGSVSINDDVSVLRRQDDSSNDNGTDKTDDPALMSTINGLFVNKGISRVPFDGKTAYAGDIVTLTGVPDTIRVGDTITGTSEATRITAPIETPPLAPPTLSMQFGANDGPLKGLEGTEVTPSKLRARLVGEVDNNVTLSLGESTSEESTEVFARGELQLGILVETLRREGFEMVISPPKIVTKEDDDGTLVEPYEEVMVDVDSEYSGYIVSSLTGDRKGVLLEMNESADGKTRLKFEIPSRGLLGFAGEAASATRGSAIVNHVYIEDRPHAGLLGDGLEKGKLISNDSGKATQYALSSLSSRGVLFVAPGDVVYPGMIIGENAKQGDLEVNPVRAKAATNMRTQNKDEKVYLAPPKRMTVEEFIGYMADDECLEVTPSSLRLRKSTLDPVERRKASRVKKQQQDAKKKK